MVEWLASSRIYHTWTSFVHVYSIRADLAMRFRCRRIPGDVEVSQQLDCLLPEQTPSGLEALWSWLLPTTSTSSAGDVKDGPATPELVVHASIDNLADFDQAQRACAHDARFARDNSKPSCKANLPKVTIHYFFLP